MLFLFVVFNSNFRTINSIDTAVAQHTALVLAKSGRADLSGFPGLVENGVADGYIGVVDGRAYSSYPLLPALLAVPAYRVALTTGFLNPGAQDPWRLEAVGALVASTFVALACGVLFLTLARTCNVVSAALVASVCGLATPLWSSASQALWSHAPAVLLLAAGLSALLAVPADKKRRPRLLLIAGASLTLAVFCRQLLIVFPACAAFALWRLQTSRHNLGMYAAGCTLAAAAMIAVNLLLLRSPLGGFVGLYATGVTVNTHAVAGAWTGDWMSGLAGLFASPSRGMFVYMPVVLIVAAGSVIAWRDRLLRYAVVVPSGLYLVFWAKYAVWWSGHSFGPRFAADLAIPFAIIAAGTLVYWSSATALTKTIAAATVAWSITVQSIGAFSYPAGDWNGLPLNVDLTHDRLWDWHDSQLSRTIRSGTYQQYRATLERLKAPHDDDPVALTDVVH